VQTFNFSIFLTVIAALIAVLVGLWRISILSLSLSDLTHTAVLIASGDRTQRTKVRDTSEIGVLADTFNQMTEQLASTINHLDENVHKLDASNKALQIATAQAKEAARVKGEFLATMSHELRTPLNAIEGFTSIMLSNMGIDLNPRATSMIERISANSKRLLGLINDFLDLSRVEAGRLVLVKSPISMPTLLQHWTSQMTILAERKNLAFQTELDPEMPEIIVGDEEALTKVVINLLSNAFKFTANGSVKLRVGLLDKNRFVIQVSDTGIGIPPHAREYIFEEFRQVDASSKRVYGGTGLGLAIVQKFVRAMSGTVSLESELGQ